MGIEDVAVVDTMETNETEVDVGMIEPIQDTYGDYSGNSNGLSNNVILGIVITVCAVLGIVLGIIFGKRAANK